MNIPNTSEEEIPLHKREEPKFKMSQNEDLGARIKGLELAKTYEGMSPADIAALDRSIAKWRAKEESIKNQS